MSRRKQLHSYAPGPLGESLRRLEFAEFRRQLQHPVEAALLAGGTIQDSAFIGRAAERGVDASRSVRLGLAADGSVLAVARTEQDVTAVLDHLKAAFESKHLIIDYFAAPAPEQLEAVAQLAEAWGSALPELPPPSSSPASPTPPNRATRRPPHFVFDERGHAVPEPSTSTPETGDTTE